MTQSIDLLDKISTTINDSVPEMRWVAFTSNSLTVYQDDYRDGLEPHSAWLRLGEYLKENNLNLIGMQLEFRGRTEVLEQNADAYYFAKGAGAVWGGPTHQQYVVGLVKDGVLYKTTWKIPEMLVMHSETEKVEPGQDFDGRLIWNAKRTD